MQYSRMIKIKEYLEQNKTASISALSEMLGVSVVTVRKDLSLMEKNGIIVKTHGGAVLAQMVDKSSFFGETHFPSSIEITTDLAKQFVQPGDFIYLGSGRTCLSLAEKIKDIDQISIITDNISALDILYPKVRNIVLLGGEINLGIGNCISTVNPDVGSSLIGIYCNKAFSSGVGIDANAGLTVNLMGSTYINKFISTMCDSWYLMMDSGKFGKKAFYQAAKISQITHIITDVTDEDLLEEYRSKGADIISPATVKR